MGGSYKQCSACGKRALSIATRCPGCGRELTEPAVREPGRRVEVGLTVSPRMVLGTLAAAAVAATVVFGRSDQPSATPALFTADSAAGSAEVGFSTTAPGTLDSASAAALAGGGAAEVLVARSWTHVRKSRRVGSDVEAVLLPGDTVVADSLSRGWYRVALEGEVLGYAHRSTLVAPRAR
ncbi:MAG TPA: hypothetical protein VFT84_05420 [Gemmatimonadales bacterium]|nr:hypothetical protein [Gemmatimonadales bacterium]